MKKSRNGDTLGPVELIVWPEQANQGDLREQDDQGRYLSSNLEWVSHQDFKNIAYVGFFRHFVCVFVFVVVFAIVFVFVFVSSYDFWIAFIKSFHNMYGYRGLWSLRAEIMTIFEVMTHIHTYITTPFPLIDSAHPVGWAEWKATFKEEYKYEQPLIT